MRRSARTSIAALLVLFGALVAAVVGTAGLAGAAPANCGYPANACAGPTLALSTSVTSPGGKVEVTGTGFIADRRVTLLLKTSSTASAANEFGEAHPTSRYTLVSAVTYNLVRAESYTLATVRTSSGGGFTTTVVAPMPARGQYNVVAVNGTPQGFSDPAVPLRVEAATNNNNNGPDNNKNNNEPGTAFTGFNVLWMLLLAAALIVAGVYVTRRGRSTTHANFPRN